MDDSLESSLFDHTQIKRDIADAIRTAIREHANELGISYEACIDLLLLQQGQAG